MSIPDRVKAMNKLLIVAEKSHNTSLVCIVTNRLIKVAGKDWNRFIA